MTISSLVPYPARLDATAKRVPSANCRFSQINVARQCVVTRNISHFDILQRLNFRSPDTGKNNLRG
ncbi:MAG: hypothetical protein AB1477_05885 [Acidobacteriota bacterium]